MKKREPVSSIMVKNVLFVNETDGLHDVIHIIKKNKIRHLPVKKGTVVTGIISSADLDRLTFGRLFDNQEGTDEAILEMLSVPQIMTQHPITVESDATIKDVAEIFTQKGFHALPVVDGDELVGIVTTTDIIKYMLEQY